jgi:hypothetical protein
MPLPQQRTRTAKTHQLPLRKIVHCAIHQGKIGTRQKPAAASAAASNLGITASYECVAMLGTQQHKEADTTGHYMSEHDLVVC